MDYKLERISSFGALSSRCENSLGLPFPYVHYGVKKRVISFFFFFFEREHDERFQETPILFELLASFVKCLTYLVFFFFAMDTLEIID